MLSTANALKSTRDPIETYTSGTHRYILSPLSRSQGSQNWPARNCRSNDLTKIFIEQLGNNKLEPESRDLLDEFRARGYEVTTFTEKAILRRRLPLDRNSLVAGSVLAVSAALKQLGIKVPPPNDYPTCLHRFLRRKTWHTTLSSVRESFYNALSQPVFIKPKDQMKLFTGKVIESYHDLAPLANVSGRSSVFCSEVVEWSSEYRVFVIKGQIKDMKYFAGDQSIQIDNSVVTDAVNELEGTADARAAYGIDFGVLASGETAFIELNEGFSLASYGLDRSVYADLILARWTELLNEAPER